MKVKCPRCNAKTELVWKNCPGCGNDLRAAWEKEIKRNKDSAITLAIIGGFFIFFGLFGGILVLGLGAALIAIGIFEYRKITTTHGA